MKFREPGLGDHHSDGQLKRLQGARLNRNWIFFSIYMLELVKNHSGYAYKVLVPRERMGVRRPAVENNRAIENTETRPQTTEPSTRYPNP